MENPATAPYCPATPATYTGRGGHPTPAAAVLLHRSARRRHTVRGLSLAIILLVGMLGPAVRLDVVQSAPGPTAGGVTAAREAMVPNGQFISGWGEPRSGGQTHQGEDLAAPSGSPIYAPAKLKIYHTRWNDVGGWTVLGRDARKRWWYFAHLKTRSKVRVGSKVKTGEVLGSIGNTGSAQNTVPHLHYQVSWPKGAWGNPVEVLKNYPDVP
jgi:murein DD-endopeptidase MepM/ murein hydrolase activator NlpD